MPHSDSHCSLDSLDSLFDDLASLTLEPAPMTATRPNLRTRGGVVGVYRSVLLAMVGMVCWALGIPGTVLALEGKDRPAEPGSPEVWYGETIRSAAWRSPEDEQRGFHVPEGFAVDLVLAEPRILKPMNLAFDARGRLWNTESVQYPFPAQIASDNQGASGGVDASALDSISVHEDRDGDGVFETSTVFASGLNIPIGLLPYEDGVFVFSIPNIWFLRDTDGDGRCDDRRLVLGPFDTSRDTHGMVNAMRDGGDGWIYACHGFNNVSRLAGTDGHRIELTSGNVFRFRPDGSRVEQYTQGQVNPFGMTRDPYGNWFTADCHSKPITQLLRGACYPSFGRPDDGLGFVPPMMEHLHGSTAISGLAYVPKGSFPEGFHGNLLSGNVMTCRINRNRIEYRGATAKAVEMPDLLTSDDPWFRPVDLQFGPDGHLYIADFYNRIIGHYEVPLDHPDRDRTSGRIWRIRQLHPSDAKRVEQIGTPKSSRASLTPSGPSMPSLEQALAIVGRPLIDRSDTPRALERLRAIQVLGDQAEVERLPLLMTSIADVDETFDPILKQSHWIAMRDIVARASRAEGPFPVALVPEAAIEDRSAMLLKLLRAVRTPSAARWSLELIQTIGDRLPERWSTPWLKDAVLQCSTVASESDIPQVLELLDRVTPDAGSRGEWVLRIAEAQKERNGKLSSALLELGQTTLLQQISDLFPSNPTTGEVLHAWSARPARGTESREWPTEPRRVSTEGASGPIPTSFWSSFGLGERYTGTWTSSPFDAPANLSFWIVGHNGLPSEPDLQLSYVRVLAQNGITKDWTEIQRVAPPRSDLGRFVSIDLSQSAGKRLRLQVVDGDGHDSYAWIGVADVSVAGLTASPERSRLDQLLRTVRCFGPAVVSQRSSTNASRVMEAWSQLMQSARLDAACKCALQKAMLGQEFPVVSELVDSLLERGWEDLLNDPSIVRVEASQLRPKGLETLPPYTWDWDQLDSRSLEWLADRVCRRLNASGQEELAMRWSRYRSSLRLMESLMRRGAMSKEVLRALPAAWWESLAADEMARWADLRPEGESDTSRASVVATKAMAAESIAPDLAVGARVFQERCAACHQLAGQGKLVGPQLDGAITRTVERLCEDILWPNRNVDEAFRLTNVRLESGETVSGLIVDRQADTLELIDQTGKSQRIVRSEIEAEKMSKLSLMPGSFEELITDVELASLIGYLKSHIPSDAPSIER